MSSVRKGGSRISLRARVLAIALVPSLVLLSVGLGLSSYLLVDALEQRDRAQLLAQGYQMAVPFMPAMSQERRASILMVADATPENEAALAQARGEMDTLLAQFADTSTPAGEAMPGGARAAIGVFVDTLPQLNATRELVDAGEASRLEVYQSYTSVADAMIAAAATIGHDSSSKDAALNRVLAADLMRVSDWLDGANALAAGALAADGMTVDELREYNRLTRAYHAALDTLAPRLGDQQDRLAELRGSETWQRLVAVENTIIEQGFASTGAADPAEASGRNPASGPDPAPPPALPVSTQEWQDAASTTASALSSMGPGTLGAQAAALEEDAADTALLRSLVAAIAMLLVVGVMVIISVRLSNTLTRRLVRLRGETLRLADERLPQVVDRLRAGERVDVSSEVPALDHGRDEIGQVAAAFNKAQQTAVAAAVQEAKIREGFNAVFLNIARRSQAIVHRQLQLLDTAERAVDDPDQVELLFQLDHLTTRERRNAENLIILGGGRLARQWRNSVSLLDLVRSAVAEAEQYTRVTIGRVPNIMVDGRLVADLIHLLAELIDNATSFSPPGARIEIRGNPAAKGVVVEVEDQGLGMEPERREVVNQMFDNPPDFGLLSLSEDARIGFFVVAHLAHQHGIRVHLQESAYGGVRAGVMIPSTLVSFPGRTPAEDGAQPSGTSPSPHDNGPSSQAASLLVPAAEAAQPSPGESGAAQPGVTLPGAAQPGVTLPGATQEGAVQGGAVQEGDTGTPSGTSNRPPLPRRRRQANLARQLRDDPAIRGEVETSEVDLDRAARRARERLSDFQHGTRLGRESANQPGDQPGV